eukprot:TRINITY_DN7030_c0_g1_i1.p1 TRINITY_DN7030_c0_g1~~TRINITY_DN7030_c0_g1_i1.p1  ORF type:complete len:289 (-),score=42.63 TRINITY_DN7030_c0_g1_i1:56-922(-)
MSESLNNLSISELKALLTKRGVDFRDCFEKSDLIRKVKDTESVTSTKKQQPKKTQSSVNLAGLNCKIVEAGTPEAVVLVCHGYGANADDLVSIAHYVLEKNPELQIKFVFPDGPFSMGISSFCWWDIDFQSMLMKFMRNELDQLFDEVPKRLESSRNSINSLIELLKQQTKLPLSKFIFAGFSQGSMLCLDLCLRSSSPPGALAIFSGSLICKSEWNELATKIPKTFKILQSHGTRDSILPFVVGQRLKQFLEAHGFDLDFISFVGDHTIPVEALEKFVQLINYVVKS